jgi:ring-1,2-phenylacetyl-CoA epoxidase subunit PaaE
MSDIKPQLEFRIEGQTFRVEGSRTETLLDTALKNDIDAPYSCMSGTCNSCQAKLLEGTVEMEFCDALTEDEIQSGEILTCQAIPTSDRVIVQWPE